MSELTTLPTDYIDAELQYGETMKKYDMITNDDGTYSFKDVTDYKQVGSKHTAAAVNHQNEVINELLDNSAGCKYVICTATVSAGETSLVIENDLIAEENVLIDIYSNIEATGKEHTGTNQITIYFDAQTFDFKVVVKFTHF